jgi:hypothetical protein
LENYDIEKVKEINIQDISFQAQEGAVILRSLVFPNYGFNDTIHRQILKILGKKFRSLPPNKRIKIEDSLARQSLDCFFNNNFQYMKVAKNIRLFSKLFRSSHRAKKFIWLLLSGELPNYELGVEQNLSFI